MIPLSRKTSSRKLASTLWACSRQNLPRPHRLYATASKIAQSPATATAALPGSGGYAQLMRTPPPSRPVEQSAQGRSSNVEVFLQNPIPFTLLPTPLPDDIAPSFSSMYFTDSGTQDSLAVIFACLHNCYDVPRAQHIFNRIKETRQGDIALQTQLYNSFLESFYKMAVEKDSGRLDSWWEEAWSLYDAMESGKDGVDPNANTYATMLKFWTK